MNQFEQYCDKLSILDSVTKDKLFERLETKTFRKGEYLLKGGKTCDKLFFINKGFVKMFFLKDEKEFIMRFFSEDLLFTAFESYLTSTPSRFSIVALETSTVSFIHQKHVDELCREHHGMETFMRKLISIAAVKMTTRIREMLEENATVRYKQFVKENNKILQRVSLGELAKYLGITQQSLSRIRNQK